jgi:Phosphodiester glycosidase
VWGAPVEEELSRARGASPRDARVTRRTALAALVGAGLGLSTGAAGAAPPRRPATRARVRSATALAPPSDLAPFVAPARGGEGVFRPVGRRVRGRPALYTTLLRPLQMPTVLAGVAWMDTSLLSARLYSGSLSPGGLIWKYTAPIQPAAARTLVAAFNGGFLLKDSRGGYLSEGHLVAPLVDGGASLVIYANGTATVGQWGRDVGMAPDVVAVRQNLTLLVDGGRAVPGLQRDDVLAWGASLGNIIDTPRSGLGETTDGALVYVEGPMNIVDLARILVRAGAVRAMVLDMNPLWPVFATYRPATPGGLAAPANGHDLTPSMVQSPARFFEDAYARDFITMSAL